MMLSRRQSVLLLLLLLVLSGGLGLGLGHLQYDYDVERLFPASDEELQFFQGFRERFENENDYLALAIFRAEGIFDQAFLEEVDSLGKLLRRQPHILDASSLANASFRKLNALGLGKSSPLIHIEQPKLYAQDSAFLLSVPHFRHNLLSEDARSLCLYLKIEKGLSTELADELLMNIRLLVGEFSFERVYYSGGLYTQRSQTQLVQQEMYWLGGGAVVMVFFFLLWVFRTWWGIVLPLLVVGLAVIWTLGIMGWVGAEINVMTVLIPSILMVVGVSDVVHLLNRYLEELRLQKEQAE
ncbi:MAG: MMPL family transporter, partial [Bacteroidota bacterium]